MRRGTVPSEAAQSAAAAQGLYPVRRGTVPSEGGRCLSVAAQGLYPGLTLGDCPKRRRPSFSRRSAWTVPSGASSCTASRSPMPPICIRTHRECVSSKPSALQMACRTISGLSSHIGEPLPRRPRRPVVPEGTVHALRRQTAPPPLGTVPGANQGTVPARRRTNDVRLAWDSPRGELGYSPCAAADKRRPPCLGQSPRSAGIPAGGPESIFAFGGASAPRVAGWGQATWFVDGLFAPLASDKMIRYVVWRGSPRQPPLGPASGTGMYLGS